jgi:prepilin-type N-terminal cleavage/methylation domain-containing protein
MKVKRLGFSLVELLVVTAITAVLLGVAVPSLIRAKKGAKRVACLQQVKGVAMGLVMYANSNDGLLPASVQRADVKERPDLSANILYHEELGYDLAKELGSYVAVRDLHCPEAGGPINVPSGLPAKTVYSNYVFLWGAVNGTPEQGYTKLDHAPPSAVALADLTWTIYMNNETLYAGNHLKKGYNMYRPTPFVLTGEEERGGRQFVVPTMSAIYGMNAAFMDGSAQWVERKLGTWRDAGPFHQGEYRAARVYLPARSERPRPQ